MLHQRFQCFDFFLILQTINLHDLVLFILSSANASKSKTFYFGEVLQLKPEENVPVLQLSL